MPMNQIDPGHNSVRNTLRVAGPVVTLIGLGFVIVGLVDFFHAFSPHFSQPLTLGCSCVPGSLCRRRLSGCGAVHAAWGHGWSLRTAARSALQPGAARLGGPSVQTSHLPGPFRVSRSTDTHRTRPAFQQRNG